MPPAVLVAGPNLTIDRTATLDELRPGAVLRFESVVVTPGGKGLNVARAARELGADALLTELEPEGEPFDLLLESVGGASLAAALTRVGPGGTVVAFGASSPEPTTFDVSRFYNRGAPRLYGLRVFDELVRHRSAQRDLTLLVTELAAGRLDPQIDLTVSWREADTALAALLERRVAGKAVLRID